MASEMVRSLLGCPVPFKPVQFRAGEVVELGRAKRGGERGQDALPQLGRDGTVHDKPHPMMARSQTLCLRYLPRIDLGPAPGGQAQRPVCQMPGPAVYVKAPAAVAAPPVVATVTSTAQAGPGGVTVEVVVS